METHLGGGWKGLLTDRGRISCRSSRIVGPFMCGVNKCSGVGNVETKLQKRSYLLYYGVRELQKPQISCRNAERLVPVEFD